MQLIDVLLWKFPDARISPIQNKSDWWIEDRSDGQGAQIVVWRRAEPKPTAEQLAQWADEYSAQQSGE